MEQNRTQCPKLSLSLPQCYSSRLSSSDIFSVIYFCSEHYEECAIYKDLKTEQIKEGERV